VVLLARSYFCRTFIRLAVGLFCDRSQVCSPGSFTWQRSSFCLDAFQQSCYVDVTFFPRNHGGGLAVVIWDGCDGAVREQQLQQLQIAILSGGVDGSPSSLLGCVNWRAMLQEQSGSLKVAGGYG